MNINSSEVASTVGRKIREIYTEGLLQNNLTASVKVKSYRMKYLYTLSFKFSKYPNIRFIVEQRFHIPY